ncbi:MAG: GGDEF domain-containing protein [Sedimenticola sp.]
MQTLSCDQGICFPDILRHVSSVAVAVFDRHGHLVDSNAGFKALLKFAELDERGDIRKLFVQPDFDELTAVHVDADTEDAVGQVFSGVLNLGNLDIAVRSLHGTVYSKAERFLLIAEYDINEYEFLSAAVLEMNEEMAQMQRQLKKLNNELKRSEQKLREASLTDYLTGVPNRRHFMQRGLQELAGCERSGQPLTLVICDLDHFKRINDQFGHDVGDEVLVWFSRKALEVMRTNEIFARFGGEEFVYLLPNTRQDEACHLLQRLREAMSESNPLRDERPVTASFGVVEWSRDEAMENMLKRADEALYKAKEQGRDCIVCASSAGG